MIRILEAHEDAEVDEVDEVAAGRERDPVGRQAAAVLDHDRRELEVKPRADVLADLRQRRADAEEQLLLELRAVEQADRARAPASEQPPRPRARRPERERVESNWPSVQNIGSRTSVVSTRPSWTPPPMRIGWVPRSPRRSSPACQAGSARAAVQPRARHQRRCHLIAPRITIAQVVGSAANRVELQLCPVADLRLPIASFASYPPIRATTIASARSMKACYSRVAPTRGARSPSCSRSCPRSPRCSISIRRRRPSSPRCSPATASLPGMAPYAACYGGHQFGTWAGQLGDGRAITLARGRQRARRDLGDPAQGRGPDAVLAHAPTAARCCARRCASSCAARRCITSACRRRARCRSSLTGAAGRARHALRRSSRRTSPARSCAASRRRSCASAATRSTRRATITTTLRAARALHARALLPAVRRRRAARHRRLLRRGDAAHRVAGRASGCASASCTA